MDCVFPKYGILSRLESQARIFFNRESLKSNQKVVDYPSDHHTPDNSSHIMSGRPL